MTYAFITLILIVVLLLYFKIADKYNIIDKPNHRSAHSYITLRGGGIVYWMAGAIYAVQYYTQPKYFFTGLTIIALVSFWDDIKSLPNKTRLLAHFSAITLVFYELKLFHLLPLFAIVGAYVFFIGIINAYNFMDGINGITGLYTIAVFSSFFYVNQSIIAFVNQDFVLYPILASVVFLFFNFRKQAKCFAGDIGSIAIAFWIVFVMIKLILATDSFVWLLFLAVYGADAGCTILHRLYLKENIFEAHKHHYYQILTNDLKIDHRWVSALYFVLQIFVSVMTIMLYQSNDLIVMGTIIILLIAIYFTKFYWIKKIK